MMQVSGINTSSIGIRLLQATPLINVVIDLMIHDKNFDPEHEFMSIYKKYAISFLDAKLMAILWDEMQANKDQNITIMVTQGADHVAHLSTILEMLSSTVRSICPDREGEIIMPSDMNKYLNEHDLPQKKENCLVM